MQFVAFCSFFQGSYLGTPAIQFETGSHSSNDIVKVPIDVIHVVNGSTGIDIFSCMSLHFALSLKLLILSQQRTQTILITFIEYGSRAITGCNMFRCDALLLFLDNFKNFAKCICEAKAT
jgi:hypothetical protein